jgi:hypothetical protein
MTLPSQRRGLARPAVRSLLGLILGLAIVAGGALAPAPPARAGSNGSLSDEDILNPKKLIFDKVVPFTDSFDGASVGTVFVSKRAILGHPVNGVLGESCGSLCAPGTDEVDASYVYVFQKKGACVIGVRGIGWGEKAVRFSNGQTVEIGRVRHTSSATNIQEIIINGVRVGPPTNMAQLGAPNGTNYKYYPRRSNSFGKTMGGMASKLFNRFIGAILAGGSNNDSNGYETFSSTNEGYITDIHYFPAGELATGAKQGEPVVIDMPAWQPSRHVIGGDALTELRKLTDTCDAE